MNSRERVAAAMGHRIPDRVPVLCQLALGHYFLHSQFEPAEIWFDSEVFVRTLSESTQLAFRSARERLLRPLRLCEQAA